MRTLRMLLTASVAVALGAGALGAPAGAAPGAGAQAAPARAFTLAQGSGPGRLEVELVQRRGTAAVGGAAATAGGAAWSACVFGWTASSFFSDCSEPVSLSSSVAEGSASGRLRFALRDDFWGDTAVVDLTLRDAGRVPTVSVGAQPYADRLRVSSAPYASLARTAAVSGSVVVTTKRGRTRAAKRYVVPRGAAVQVRETVAGSAGGGL